VLVTGRGRAYGPSVLVKYLSFIRRHQEEASVEWLALQKAEKELFVELIRRKCEGKLDLAGGAMVYLSLVGKMIDDLSGKTLYPKYLDEVFS
jgi:hypothetical protein